MPRRSIDPPPPHIAAAFGLGGIAPCPVQGGQGVTFRLGEAAIKRCDDPEQTEWLWGVLETVEEDGFRIARPIHSKGGSFVVGGWCAMRWIDGTPAVEGRWHEMIEACQAFHRAVSRVPYSPVLERAENPWARADGVVWARPEEIHIGPVGQRLCRAMRPVALPSQLVHADASEGNFLFAAGRPPGVIDIAPYWRPADYAVAMLVADSIAWSGAPVELLAHVAGRPQMDQLLIRAVLFRLYVGYLFRGGEAAAERRAQAYAPVIEAVAP